jgi:AraC-like DNA-binding protein
VQEVFLLCDGCVHIKDYEKTELRHAVKNYVTAYFAQKDDQFLANYIARQFFSIFIVQFIECMLLKNNNNEEKLKSYRRLHRVNQSIVYIHNYYYERISVKELASLSDMSEKYFITYFKETIGLSPHQYQIQMRMQQASKLLAEEKYTVGEIAELSGFNDQYNFSTAFKKYYEICPSRYLKDSITIVE